MYLKPSDINDDLVSSCSRVADTKYKHLINTL